MSVSKHPWSHCYVPRTGAERVVPTITCDCLFCCGMVVNACFATSRVERRAHDHIQYGLKHVYYYRTTLYQVLIYAVCKLRQYSNGFSSYGGQWIGLTKRSVYLPKPSTACSSYLLYIFKADYLLRMYRPPNTPPPRRRRRR